MMLPMLLPGIEIRVQLPEQDSCCSGRLRVLVVPKLVPAIFIPVHVTEQDTCLCFRFCYTRKNTNP